MIHKKLAKGRWFNLSFFEQMANIGSEVERTIIWKERNKDYSFKAFVRLLELLDLTITDKKNLKKLRELTRVREVIVDYFYGKNEYGSSDNLWRSYFYPFNFAVRKDR